MGLKNPIKEHNRHNLHYAANASPFLVMHCIARNLFYIINMQTFIKTAPSYIYLLLMPVIFFNIVSYPVIYAFCYLFTIGR